MARVRSMNYLGWLALGAAVVFALWAAPAAADGQKAAVHTIASDWSGAAQAVVNVNPVGGPRGTQLDLFPQASTDWIIRSYGDYFYLIGRYYTDSLTKFHIDAPETPLYQVSVLASGSDTSNPHDLIFLNADKAYMPMYGVPKCWIIDPNDGSKIGEIDLSAYADSDGLPELQAGIIVGDKLFLLAERLNRNAPSGIWEPQDDAYLIVIDTGADTEIDTNAGRTALKGVKLPAKGPNSIMYLPENNLIYIACTGVYPGLDPSSPYLYTGGIVTVDPDTYTAELLLDDGPDGPSGSHPYGAISRVMVVSPDNGYFIGYKGWGDNYLYKFDPTTGKVTKSIKELAGKSLVGPGDMDRGSRAVLKSMSVFDGKNLVSNESGVSLDENGMLWVSVAGDDHAVYILNTATDGINEKVDTNLNPGSIAFCPQTVMPGDNEVNSASGSGLISVAPDQGIVSALTAYSAEDFDDAAGLPDGLTFPDGLVGFTIDSLPVTGAGEDGTSVEVTITFPSERFADAVYYKINADGDFEALDAANVEQVDFYTVILTLVDGGVGDSDGEKNGVIVDPGGWAGTAEDDGDDDADGDGGGGGGGSGCFIRALY